MWFELFGEQQKFTQIYPTRHLCGLNNDKPDLYTHEPKESATDHHDPVLHFCWLQSFRKSRILLPHHSTLSLRMVQVFKHIVRDHRDCIGADAYTERNKKSSCMGHFYYADCIYTQSYLFYSEGTFPAGLIRDHASHSMVTTSAHSPSSVILGLVYQ